MFVTDKCDIGIDQHLSYHTGSVPSLVAGLGFGAALAVGAQQVSANPANFYLSLVTSSVLLAVMGTRFRRSGKMMPAGLVAAIR